MQLAEFAGAVLAKAKLVNSVAVVVILLAMAAGLRLLAGRLNVPPPVLLVLGGLALAFA